MSTVRFYGRCSTTWFAVLIFWLAVVSASAQEPEKALTGLEAEVPVFEVDNRPIKEVLNLLSRFSGLNFITSGAVQDVPVTAKMTKVTVKQILDTVLPRYGLNYIKKTGEDFITVMTQPEWDAEMTKKPELHTRTFDILYVPVDNIAPVITQLKSPDGTLFIIPHQRRIIATDYLERLETMERTIKELDMPTVRITIRLKYINAEEARQQLQQVISPSAVVQVDLVNNTIIIEDIPQNIAEVEAILADLDRPRPLMVFEIQYVDPAEIIDMIESLGILTEQAQIDYHEGTNKILLQDIPSRVELAQQVIEALDAPPLQIYIEARIMDVNLDRMREISPAYEWGKDVDIGSATGGLEIDSANLLVRFLAGRTRVTDLTTLFGENFKLIVEALESDGVLRTISTPFGRVRNHKELYFQDGAEEPFLVRQRRIGTTTIGGDEIFTQRSRNVGRILSVEPHANSSGHVYMIVIVEDSDAENVFIEQQTLLRVIEKTVETEVDVKTGHTVALGGLIFEKEDVDISGFPYLKDIPLLGMLFRTENISRTRRKLVIFITPYVENLEDPFERYEAYVEPAEEEVSEFQGLDFTWDDEEAPVRYEKNIYQGETPEDLPEEYRKFFEGPEGTGDGSVHWIEPSDEDQWETDEPSPEGTKQTEPEAAPEEKTETDPLEKEVPVF